MNLKLARLLLLSSVLLVLMAGCGGDIDISNLDGGSGSIRQVLTALYVLFIIGSIIIRPIFPGIFESDKKKADESKKLKEPGTPLEEQERKHLKDPKPRVVSREAKLSKNTASPILGSKALNAYASEWQPKMGSPKKEDFGLDSRITHRFEGHAKAALEVEAEETRAREEEIWRVALARQNAVDEMESDGFKGKGKPRPSPTELLSDDHRRYRSVDMPMKKKLAEFKFDGKPYFEIVTEDTDIPKDYLAGKDADRIMEVSQPTLRRWQREGKLRAIKRGNVWYYLQEDLLRNWVAVRRSHR